MSDIEQYLAAMKAAWQRALESPVTILITLGGTHFGVEASFNGNKVTRIVSTRILRQDGTNLLLGAVEKVERDLLAMVRNGGEERSA